LAGVPSEGGWSEQVVGMRMRWLMRRQRKWSERERAPSYAKVTPEIECVGVEPGLPGKE